MSLLTVVKDRVVSEHRRNPIAFWVWILLCIGAIAAYAYLKTSGH
jgi:hypothetical protein